MKKILITGVNSYVGTNVNDWLSSYPDMYLIDTISIRDDSWKNKDFSKYDVVFHVAGIAHVSTKLKYKDQYFKVNRDLAIEVAKKSKNSGVKQFIFMSSIIVYGDGRINEGVITKNTVPKPTNFYGESKLQAEEGIKLLENDNFKIAIIRSPMIYGNGSKGNYLKLSKLAKKIKIFPKYNNKRSMIHIDNLCEFIKLIIDNEEKGIFFPQNSEYLNTSILVKEIAKINKRKLYLIPGFNFLINILRKKILVFDKLFGDLYYEKEMSSYEFNYNIRNFEESVVLSEGVESEKK